MSESPPRLHQLLVAAAGPAREAAWSAFLERYTEVIVGAAREVASDADEAMDCYAFAAERLRQDDFRRLRRYRENGAAEFDTWLSVVVKRMCVDRHRMLYGRRQGNGDLSPLREAEWRARRNLAGLIAADVETLSLPDRNGSTPEESLEARERTSAIQGAIAELERRDQLLLTLRFEDGAAMADIASALGMPTRFHVHRRLKQVLNVLEGKLARRGIDAP